MSSEITVVATPNVKRKPSVLPPLSRIPTARIRPSADPLAKFSLHRTPTSGRLICSPPPLSARLRATGLSDSHDDEIEFFSSQEETGTATPSIRLSPCLDDSQNNDTLAHDLAVSNSEPECNTDSGDLRTIESPIPRLSQLIRNEARTFSTSAKLIKKATNSKLTKFTARDVSKNTLEPPPRLLPMTATASDGQSIETLQELSQQKSPLVDETTTPQLPPLPSTKMPQPKLPLEHDRSLDRRLQARSAMSKYMPLQPIKARKISD